MENNVLGQGNSIVDNNNQGNIPTPPLPANNEYSPVNEPIASSNVSAPALHQEYIASFGAKSDTPVGQSNMSPNQTYWPEINPTDIKPEAILIEKVYRPIPFFLKPKFILSFLFIIIILITSTLSITTYTLGTGVKLAKLNAFIPVEKIPFIKDYRKSDSDLIRDSLGKIVLDYLNDRDYDIESKSNLNFDMASNDDSYVGNFNSKILINTDNYLSQDGKKAKYKVQVGGNINTKDIALNLGNDGVVFNGILPNNKTLYSSFNISKPVFDKIKEYGKKYDGYDDQYFNNIEKYFDKFIKFSMTDTTSSFSSIYGANIFGIPSINDEHIKNIKEIIKNELSTDLFNLYSDTYGDFKSYSDITYEGRETINNKISIVLNVKLKEDKIGDVNFDFLAKSKSLLVNKKSTFIKICKELSSDSKADPKEIETKCTEDYDYELKSFGDINREEIKKSTAEMFKYVGFEDNKFYISPIDNNLNKVETKIVLRKAALDTIKFSKFEVYLSNEEVSRGKNIAVEEPKDYINYEDFIEKLYPVSYSQARDTTRNADIEAISSAIDLYLIDGKTFASLGNIPLCTQSKIVLGTGKGNLNLKPKLVSDYLVNIPKDPSTGTDENTGYSICKNKNSRVTVSAKSESGKEISITK